MLGCPTCGSLITDRHEPGCTHPLATNGSHFTAPEVANFLAAKAIAYAGAFLDNRSGAAQLATEADQLMLDMLALPHHPDAQNIGAATRMLVIVMMRMARCGEPWRLERWRRIAAGLVDLVRRESRDLRESGAQRS